MGEILKKYWFVWLVALGLAGALGYYIYDLTKDNVSGKSVDGKEVVASLSIGDITSQDLYDSYEPYQASILYNMYRNAIIDQTVETTEELTSQAKQFARNVEANMDSDTTGEQKIDVETELASFGFDSLDKLQDYTMMYLKSREMDREFVRDHLDLLLNVPTSKPKTIALIKMDVADASNLTEEETKKQEDIDAQIEAEGFEKAAEQFSDDVETAGNEGFYGYVDQNSEDLDSQIISAIADLGNGQMTDWITVTDSETSTTSLYKVKVVESSVKALFNSDDIDIQNSVLSAIIDGDNAIEVRAVENKAKELDIKFENEEQEKELKDYIQQQLDSDASTFNEKTSEEKEAKEKESEEADKDEAADETAEDAAEQTADESAEESDQEGADNE